MQQSPIDRIKCQHCGGMFLQMDIRLHQFAEQHEYNRASDARRAEVARKEAAARKRAMRAYGVR